MCVLVAVRNDTPLLSFRKIAITQNMGACVGSLAPAGGSELCLKLVYINISSRSPDRRHKKALDVHVELQHSSARSALRHRNGVRRLYTGRNGLSHGMEIALHEAD